MKKGYYLTLVYKDLNLPLRKYEAIMRGFARKSQLDILKVYFKTSFFEDFCYVLNNHGKEYAISYFNWMNPCFLVNENMIKKFQRLLTSIPNEENDIKVLITSSI